MVKNQQRQGVIIWAEVIAVWATTDVYATTRSAFAKVCVLLDRKHLIIRLKRTCAYREVTSKQQEELRRRRSQSESRYISVNRRIMWKWKFLNVRKNILVYQLGNQHKKQNPILFFIPNMAFVWYQQHSGILLFIPITVYTYYLQN